MTKRSLSPKRLPLEQDLSNSVDEPQLTMTATDAAEYIAQMAAELARIARTARLESLAYFLEMTRIEATTTLRRLPGPG